MSAELTVCSTSVLPLPEVERGIVVCGQTAARPALQPAPPRCGLAVTIVAPAPSAP